MDHVCLRVEALRRARRSRRICAEHGVRIGEVGLRYGADGFGPSLYLFDPEGNMVELKGPPEGGRVNALACWNYRQQRPGDVAVISPFRSLGVGGRLQHRPFDRSPDLRRRCRARLRRPAPCIAGAWSVRPACQARRRRLRRASRL